MRYRLMYFSILIVVLVGAAAVGGTFLGHNLNAAPQTGPSVQAVEGTFPLDFQGVLLDGEGTPVQNGSHRLTFAIYNRETGNSDLLWSESQTVFTLDGLFTAELGVDEDIDPTIFSENPETYLGIRVDSDLELSPRIRLSYAPYAMHAVTADNVTNPPLNVNQIAMQRWYEANNSGLTINVDDSPGQMVFDGDNVWVTTQGDDDDDDDDNITKIRVSDGSKLTEIEVDSRPSDMIFDGRNIWVSLRGTDELFRLRADGSRRTGSLPLIRDVDGNVIFDALDSPTKMLFDGKHIWVVNSGNNTLSKVRVEDSVKVEIITGVYEMVLGSTITDLAFDGEHIWALHADAQNVTLIKALEVTIDPADEDFAEFRTDHSFGEGGDAIAFDGVNMWIVDKSNSDVTKVRVSDLEEVATFSVGLDPTNIAFDGRAMWIVNESSNNVMKLRASDGKELGRFHVGESPAGIVFDGVNMWVSNAEDNTVVMR